MIPKIIWQTHKESYSNLPDYMKICAESWQKLNPNYEYKYLDDKDMDSFIVKYFGQEWLDLLNSCPLKIMKVDTWKYMILYVHGGVFADIDYICKEPIDSWSSEEQNLIIFQDDKFLEFTQAVFASEPNNIILKKTIDRINYELLNIDYKSINELVGRITGYRQFSIAISDILNLKQIKKTYAVKTYNDFNNLDIVKKMKIYTPYFKNWDRYNKNNELFYTLNGRINWENNYGNWLEEQKQFQINEEKMGREIRYE